MDEYVNYEALPLSVLWPLTVQHEGANPRDYARAAGVFVARVLDDKHAPLRIGYEGFKSSRHLPMDEAIDALRAANEAGKGRRENV